MGSWSSGTGHAEQGSERKTHTYTDFLHFTHFIQLDEGPGLSETSSGSSAANVETIVCGDNGPLETRRREEKRRRRQLKKPSGVE